MPLPIITLVLSMHRSGSSTITQLIHTLGIYLGDSLEEGREDNPDGYWEYIPLVRLHERMLTFYGYTWYLPGSIPNVEVLLEQFGEEARQLVTTMDASGTHWAWKDPRMPIFLEFWMEILKGREVLFVITQRNPEAIAASLARRDGIPQDLSKALWIYSQLNILKYRSFAQKYLVLRYESILNKPEHALRQLYNFFEALLPDTPTIDYMQRMSAIIRPELSHFNKTTTYPEDQETAHIFELLEEKTQETSTKFASSLLQNTLRVFDAYHQSNFRLISKPERIRFYYANNPENPTFTFLCMYEGIRDHFVFKFPEAKPIVQFRIGVLDTYAIVTLNQVEVYLHGTLLDIPIQVSSNASSQVESTYYFDTPFPQLLFSTPVGIPTLIDEVRISLHYEKTGIEAIKELHLHAQHQLQELQARYTSLQATYMELQATHNGLQHAYTSIQTAYNSSFQLVKQIFRILRRKLQRRTLKLLKRLGLPEWIQLKTLPYSVADQWNIFWYSLQNRRYFKKQKDYVPYRPYKTETPSTIRVLAFYLPQFHVIPENDAWWGEGFTEWSNVKPAQPQFKGHYQPRVPDALGYYNLLDPEIQTKQVALAKNYGISGFCFHFYWFNGKRLLEAPILEYVRNTTLDFPFCLSWANENWSRRWDGKAEDILIQQAHSPEDDIAFISYVSKYFKDSRYIKIDGKPLLLVYRPGVLPNARETTMRWRRWCRENAIGELYIACSQVFDAVDPTHYGMDAALEFPPNNFGPSVITDQVSPMRSDFGMTIYDWRTLLPRKRKYTDPGYTLFRGVCPSWDNTARRKHKGTAFLHSHPAHYGKWLFQALLDTQTRIIHPEERLVFINAWNEWAEGAYLEPDARYGYAFLDATRKAINRFEQMRSSIGRPTFAQRGKHWLRVQKIYLENIFLQVSTQSKKNTPQPYQGKLLVVSHDAHPNGAQMIALEIVRTLTQDLKLEVEVILLGPGPLKSKFEALARVHDLSKFIQHPSYLQAFARQCTLRGWDKAILNTTVSGTIIPFFAQQGIHCISLIHELPKLINSYQLQGAVHNIGRYSTSIIFPHSIVRDGFSALTTLTEHQPIIRPQGIYTRNKGRFQLQLERNALRASLGVPNTAQIILGAGYADHRKGIDLFVEIGCIVLNILPETYMVWIGTQNPAIQKQIEVQLAEYPHRDRFIFTGFQADVSSFFAGADVFALTSREDPFPSVVLEAFDVAMPVVAFKDTGGAAALIDTIQGGQTVSAFDVHAFSNALVRLLSNRALRVQSGQRGQQYLDDTLSYRKYVFFLAEQFGMHIPKVSVIVPNYNYDQHLIARLDSIRKQTFPIYELIILDDASTDQSREVILDWMATTRMECRLQFNSTNSGAVLTQWKRGVDLANGHFIWIAEADDLCDPDFLETVYAPMHRHPDVVLSYCESKQIDSSGQLLAEHYHEYLKDVSALRWQQDYIRNGMEEIPEALAVLNTIPNVSGVLFRSAPLKHVLETHFEALSPYKRAFDFLTYIRVLEHGKIAYSRQPANQHRRHTQSVIGASDTRGLYDEIVRIQTLVAAEYNVSETVLDLAAQYRVKLRSQFGFDE